ncbi:MULTISPECIES: acyltransferase family protein [unclassified Myroides]|uniref:acyltransferase family protein n=1 Tax=unclassified Myroides TaxID=2642485 RepID=UPI003101614D
MGFRYDIQGLRALAVLLVFVFHLNPAWLSGGFVGVDVFFVISGFLVSSIILHKKDKNTFSFKDFYSSRIKRIVPVFYVFLLIVAIVGLWIYLSIDIKGLRGNLFNSMVFNSNNFLAKSSDYFGASSQENPLLHTWTLSLEMQFYFLLPLFLLLTKRKWIVPLALVLIGSLFAYSFYNSTYADNQSLMYFSLFSRIPEFLIGVVFAVKGSEIKQAIQKYENLIAVIAVIGLLVVGVLFNEHTNFPGLWVLLPCLFTALLLITTDSTVNAILSNRVLVHIGELSYSIYLWHWTIMAYIRYYTVRATFTWYEIVLIALLTYGVSWVSYRFLENTFRKYDNKKFILSFTGIPILLVLLIFTLPKVGSKVNNSILPLYSSPTFGMDSHAGSFIKVGVLGDTLAKSNNICLIGDSHALAYKAFFDEVGKVNNLQFQTVSRDVFPLIGDFDRSEFASESDYKSFKKLQGVSDALIAESDFIFVSSEWMDKVKSLDKVMAKLVENLKPQQKIIIVGDYPLFKDNLIRVNRSVLEKDNKNKVVGKVKELPAFLKELIQESDQVVLMPLNYEKILSLPYINDTIAYYDKSHLNAYGSRKLAAFFEADVRAFLLEQGVIQEK